MRRSTIPLVLLAALTFFSGVGHGAITDADEAFYAESAREMVESGDWLTPHYNYEPRFQKPALYYWLTAATFLVTGPADGAARFWSALAGLGLVLVTAACGRRWFDDDTGLLAGAIVATTFGYFSIARMALPDLPLTLFITLSIYAGFVATLDRERFPRRWLVAAAASAALGFLMKGPVAVVLPAIVVLPLILIERRSLNVTVPDMLLAFVVFAALGFPWYAAMWMRHGGGYLESFFVGDNLERFTTARFNDPRPWWFYLPVLAGGLLPWTPLAIVWLGPIVQFVTRRRDIGTIELRLLFWAFVPLIFYTLSVGKQPRYVLPVLPPMALLLASSVLERTRHWRSLDGARVRPRPSRSVVVGCVAAGLFLVTFAALLYRARPLFPEVPVAMLLAAVIAIGVSGAVVALVSTTRAWRTGPGLLAVAAAITFAVLPYAMTPAAPDSAVVKLARMVTAAREGSRPIGTYHAFVRNLIFYTGVQQTDLLNDDHVARFLRDYPKALLVLPVAELERLERERGWQFKRIGTTRYFDEAAMRVSTVVAPDVERDLQLVVLASLQ